MSYRISTEQLYQNSADNINKNQMILSKLTQELGSNLKSNLTPDEINLVDSYNVQISIKGSYLKNSNVVKLELSQQENVFNAISNKLSTLYETAIGINSPNFNKNLAIKTIDDLKKDIVNLGNTKDSNGNYLFSGYSNTTKPFSDLNTYNGDQGINQVQISDTQFIDKNIIGSNVITKNLQDSFSKIENVINNNINDPSLISSIQNAISDVSNQKTSIGNKDNQINSMITLNTNFNNENFKNSSNITNVDVASLSVKLSNAMLNYQASIKSYDVIQNMSLFNYIK